MGKRGRGDKRLRRRARRDPNFKNGDGMCFWDGVVDGLQKVSGKVKFKLPQQVIDYCNMKIDLFEERYMNIIWNGESISEQEFRENHVGRIKSLDKKDRCDGYCCGACDSFLLLLCCCFEINMICRQYTPSGEYVNIVYLYDRPDEGYLKNKTLVFRSSPTHFSFEKMYSAYSQFNKR